LLNIVEDSDGDHNVERVVPGDVKNEFDATYRTAFGAVYAYICNPYVSFAGAIGGL
jgi:hypothetical protein